MKVSHNAYKSDVFSQGLIVLEAGLMKSIQSIYDENRGVVSEEAVENLLSKFIEKYPNNPLQITTVRKMLEINESYRPDFVNIKSAIPSYDEICEYFENNSGTNQDSQERLV